MACIVTSFMRKRHTGMHGLVVAAALALGLGAPIALYAGMPRPQKHESRHEIDHLEDSWRDAVMMSNAAQLDKLLADDFLGITAFGTVQTKEETLASLRTGRMKFTTLAISDRKVRFYGTTALVTSVADVQGSTSDGDLSGNFRYTHVYVRDPQGMWKIVSFEASRIREPGEHK
jgi:ketosteroid isomerase-like protein